MPSDSMRATLYEALGIPQTASDEEVRAALRRLIRKYYAKTRDGQGNVEEALRFINHASRILSDHDRRVRYDDELAVSRWHDRAADRAVVSKAMAETGERTDVDSRSPTGGRTRRRWDAARQRRVAGAQRPSPGAHRTRRVVRSIDARDRRAVRALRRVHRRRDRRGHACRHRAGREAGAGLAHPDASRPDDRLWRRPWPCVGAAPRRHRRRRC